MSRRPRRTLRRKSDRYALAKASQGRCAECGMTLPENWHADHIVPYRIQRRTNVHDMQALCPPCNLRKGGAPR